MKVKFTEKERVVLGFDDPAFREELRQEEALLLDVLPKLTGKIELSAEELDALKEEVANAATSGADPAHTKTVKGIRRKLKM